MVRVVEGVWTTKPRIGHEDAEHEDREPFSLLRALAALRDFVFQCLVTISLRTPRLTPTAEKRVLRRSSGAAEAAFHV